MRRIVSGFNHPDFNREIIAELEPLRASDAVRDRRHGRAPHGTGGAKAPK
jgi:hypothetical protein